MAYRGEGFGTERARLARGSIKKSCRERKKGGNFEVSMQFSKNPVEMVILNFVGRVPNFSKI